MRISNILQSLASWLESPNNEVLLLSEYHDESMKIVANNLVLAAKLLKNAAEEVEEIEPQEESKLNSDSIESIAALAQTLDESGIPELQKQASVLDELLLTVAYNPVYLAEKKAAEDKHLDDIKKRYHDTKKQLDVMNKVSDSIKDIEKSNVLKETKIHSQSLSTRYCPDHAGVNLIRVDDGVYQCSMDKKIFDFENGYNLENGDKVLGSSVSGQNQNLDEKPHALFDTREGRLNSNKA